MPRHVQARTLLRIAAQVEALMLGLSASDRRTPRRYMHPLAALPFAGICMAALLCKSTTSCYIPWQHCPWVPSAQQRCSVKHCIVVVTCGACAARACPHSAQCWL